MPVVEGERLQRRPAGAMRTAYQVVAPVVVTGWPKDRVVSNRDGRLSKLTS
jgi:hypothetical protein